MKGIIINIYRITLYTIHWFLLYKYKKRWQEYGEHFNHERKNQIQKDTLVFSYFFLNIFKLTKERYFFDIQFSTI
jgi:hypothetical protein